VAPFWRVSRCVAKVCQGWYRGTVRVGHASEALPSGLAGTQGSPYCVVGWLSLGPAQKLMRKRLMGTELS
jgi:hypothetical protein